MNARPVARGLMVALTIAAGGCGGIVAEPRNSPDGGGGDGGAGGLGGVHAGGGVSHGGSGVGSGDTPGLAGGANGAFCGDGIVNQPGEACDGLALDITCASATMGARPAGALRCSAACTWDLSGCVGPVFGGAPGTGGSIGAGGRGAGGRGAGGRGAGGRGAGGRGAGGTLESGGAGATGGITFDQCQNTPSILTPDCTATCGCKVCPDVYARCRADGGCAWILACAQQQGCATVDQCYQTNCSAIIDRAGGTSSSGAIYADAAFSCLAQSGCGIACQ